MHEKFKPTSQEESVEDLLIRSRVFKIGLAFREAEAVFHGEGRDKGKKCLPQVYDTLMAVNKHAKDHDWKTIWAWNPEGDLSEEEYNALNLRRKKLSNEIGSTKSNDVVRHDLNKIE